MTDSHAATPHPEGTEPWWKSQLNIIGLFIGTHGLAVFLVVFYTVYLYPRSEAERKEWIEQITRVRQLIEPETRALTATQAEAVLSIARRSFSQDLQSNLELFSNYSERGGMSWSDSSISFWGEDFRIKAPDGDDANELNQIMKRFNSLFDARQAEFRRGLLGAFDRASSNAEVLRYQLGRLRSEQSTLDEVWQRATEPLRQEWIANTAKLSDERTRYAVDEFKKFLVKQKSYEKLLATDAKLFENLKPSEIRTEASPVAKVSALLEQGLAKELKVAYTAQRQ